MECDTTLLQASILEQQDKLYDVKMECFAEIKKIVDKVKMVEKHLEIVSQTYQSTHKLKISKNGGALKIMFLVAFRLSKAMT